MKGSWKWKVTAFGFWVSLRGKENILELVVMVAQSVNMLLKILKYIEG